MSSRLTIQPFGEELAVEPGESLLEAILRQGRFVQHGCKHGGCGSCRARLVSGECRLGEQSSFSLSDADRQSGMVLLCAAYPEQEPVVIDVAETMELSAEQFAAGVEVQECLTAVDRVEACAPSLRILRLRLLEPAALRFTAGQYVEVEVPGGQGEWRAYSVASAPGESGALEFVIKLVPGGRFSTALEAGLSPGARLRVRGPFGHFRVRLSHRPMLMIAGGSGIAPLRSMLHDLRAGGSEREVTLLYGARTEPELVYLEELRELERACAWFTLVPVLSAPGEAWGGERGRVTEVLARRFPSLRGVEGYVCGSPALVDTALRLLVQAGCKERHLAFDRFVPSGGA